IFVYNLVSSNAIAIDLNLAENYTQAPNCLGLTNFSTVTITAKLKTNKLSNIPTGNL
ncbi:39835_t:CDS:1, partial [Gigaspora margarita]